jgi:uncharacterized protein YehS (DUF1456 family)
MAKMFPRKKLLSFKNRILKPPMTNNDIFKKLRVALKLRNTDIIKILALVDFKVTESELGALFRAEDHPNYMPCATRSSGIS